MGQWQLEDFPLSLPCLWNLKLPGVWMLQIDVSRDASTEVDVYRRSGCHSATHFTWTDWFISVDLELPRLPLSVRETMSRLQNQTSTLWELCVHFFGCETCEVDPVATLVLAEPPLRRDINDCSIPFKDVQTISNTISNTILSFILPIYYPKNGWFTDGLPMVWWYDLTKKKPCCGGAPQPSPNAFSWASWVAERCPCLRAVMSAAVVNMLDTWVWRTPKSAIHPHLSLHEIPIKTSQTGCPKLRVNPKIAGIDEWMNGSVSPPWCILRFDEKNRHWIL